MEFDEMKKIWDSQNNRVLFAIDEGALHRRVQSKKHMAGRTAEITERLLIITNVFAAILTITVSVVNDLHLASSYLMAAWMLLTAAFVFVNRSKRLRSEGQFDRTVLGDLEHAISNASYQVRLSYLMRWNIIPIVIFVSATFWERGTPWWIVVLILALFGLAHLGSNWEHGIYRRRKIELEGLRTRLQNEPEIIS